MTTRHRLMILTGALAALVATFAFAQRDMPGGPDGGFGDQGMGGFGMEMIEPGTYSNEEAGYSIRIPDGFSGMSLPAPVSSIWVAEGMQMQSMEGGADGLQFMVFSSPAGSSDDGPGFETDDPEELARDLENLQGSGRMPGGNYVVDDLRRVSVGGRQAVRMSFSLEADETGADRGELYGIVYSLRHEGRAIVVQYLGGPGMESRVRSFAERNIQTLSVD